MTNLQEALTDITEQAQDIAHLSDPLEVLRSLGDLERAVMAGREAAAQLARFSGHSWAEVGDALGMSKQAAWERFA